MHWMKLQSFRKINSKSEREERVSTGKSATGKPETIYNCAVCGNEKEEYNDQMYRYKMQDGTIKSVKGHFLPTNTKFQ